MPERSGEPELRSRAEHGTSVNNVGISTSIGGGILWGTAQCMRHQRIKHASPVSSALHHPNALIQLEAERSPTLSLVWEESSTER